VRAAAESGVISGTVLGPAGVPLAGICVTASGPRGRQVARTNGNGSYTLTGMPAGAYSVGYADCASPDSYSATAYPGGAVDVVSGQRASLEPVALAATSPAQAIATEQAYVQAHESAAKPAAVKYAVTGRVRNKSGKPLAGICVTALAGLKINSKARHPVYFFLVDVTKTNRQGFYAIRALPTALHVASWKVLFAMGCGNGGNYAPQWWRGKPSSVKASTISAKPYKITGIDAVMTEGASIAGVIRGRNAHGPGLKGACVQATGIYGQEFVNIVAHTRAGGRYVLHGLGTGSYRVYFSPCQAGNYLSASHGKVQVRVDKTKTVSGFLVAGATIAGTVTSSEAGHAKLDHICVYLSGAKTGLWVTTTAKSGGYSIDRLPHGSYYVGLAGCGDSGSYAPQFYRKGASTGSLSAAAATAISLGVGKKYTANVAMLPGGTIEGTVTGQPSGGPLRDVCVEVLGQSGFGGLFLLGGPIILEAANFAETNSAGQYRIANLTPGLYVADFTECLQKSRYSSAWFAPEGGSSPQWVSVAGGATVGVAAGLPRAGTITGTVTDLAG
jgi:Carboxypeptidase regulatory-like domain